VSAVRPDFRLLEKLRKPRPSTPVSRRRPTSSGNWRIGQIDMAIEEVAKRGRSKTASVASSDDDCFWPPSPVRCGAAMRQLWGRTRQSAADTRRHPLALTPTADLYHAMLHQRTIYSDEPKAHLNSSTLAAQPMKLLSAGTLSRRRYLVGLASSIVFDGYTLPWRDRKHPLRITKGRKP
jgi:hypothetical protein